MVIWLLALTALVAGIVALHVPWVRNNLIPERFLDWLAFEHVVVERHVTRLGEGDQWEIGGRPMHEELEELKRDAKRDRTDIRDLESAQREIVSTLESMRGTLRETVTYLQGEKELQLRTDAMPRSQVLDLVTTLHKDVQALIALNPSNVVRAGIKATTHPDRMVAAYRPDFEALYSHDFIPVREALPGEYGDAGYHPIFNLWLVAHPKDDEPVDVIEVADRGTLTYTGVRVPAMFPEKISQFVYTGHRRV